MLLRYAIERLLYRLSQSAYADRFVLTGAMLFSVWAAVPYRATGDLDLLGVGASTAARLVETFRTVCETAVPPDGVEFLADTVRADQVREHDAYQGVRVTLEARLAGARLFVQVDIGFGDVIVPPAPRIAYPRETVVAEKFQTLEQSVFRLTHSPHGRRTDCIRRARSGPGGTRSAATLPRRCVRRRAGGTL